MGFYVFRLPFYQMLQSSLMLLTVLTIFCVGALYAALLAVSARPGAARASTGRQSAALSHVSVLLFVLLADWGAGFPLDH